MSKGCLPMPAKSNTFHTFLPSPFFLLFHSLIEVGGGKCELSGRVHALLARGKFDPLAPQSFSCIKNISVFVHACTCGGQSATKCL